MMSDSVSRSYLLAEYDRQHKGPPGGARKIIEEAPSIETEIIFCKDCRHNGSFDTDCPIRWNKTDRDFCSFAERRTREQMILVNRQEAIEGVANAIWHYPNHSVLNVYDKAHELAEYAFRQVVFVEPERKTGKWIESKQRDRTICSICGCWQDLKAKFLFSFCPNCGNPMDGGLYK